MAPGSLCSDDSWRLLVVGGQARRPRPRAGRAAGLSPHILRLAGRLRRLHPSAPSGGRLRLADATSRGRGQRAVYPGDDRPS